MRWKGSGHDVVVVVYNFNQVVADFFFFSKKDDLLEHKGEVPKCRETQCCKGATRWPSRATKKKQTIVGAEGHHKRFGIQRKREKERASRNAKQLANDF